MNFNKAIFVAFNGGRCGTSVLTGSLGICGAEVGNVTTAKSVENPTGFYEIKDYQEFLRNQYPEHLKPLTPLTKPILMRKGNDTRKKLLEILNASFKKSEVIAVKAPGFCPLPLLEDVDFEIKVIHLSRNFTNQSKSIEKMWYKKDKGGTVFNNWLLDCYKWVDLFKQEYKFEYMDIAFESLINKPVHTMTEVCEFCGLNLGPVQNFINKKYSRSGF